MRPDDLERLRRPYEGDADRDFRFAEALGVASPEVKTLHREILNDLDPARCGVGWWAPHPGTIRRILISDHLLLCAMSIQTNLVEAELHLLELLDVWHQRSRLFADRIEVRGRQLFLRPPPIVSPRDELPLQLSGLHTAGFFRAIVGTLDCLGATIIGVAALPTAILRSDLDRARRSFPADRSDEGKALQADLRERLEHTIRGSGPHGWLAWATDFRNMLVHRGRRTAVDQIIPEPFLIVDFAGRPIIRSQVIPQLPKDPGRSEVEVMLHRANALVLPEAASDTLPGIRDSTVRLVQEIIAELIGIWRRRRATPALLSQPQAQWPEGASEETTGFEGYRPGSMEYDPAAIVASPSLRPRLLAAALSDDMRHRWGEFN